MRASGDGAATAAADGAGGVGVGVGVGVASSCVPPHAAHGIAAPPAAPHGRQAVAPVRPCLQRTPRSVAPSSGSRACRAASRPARRRPDASTASALTVPPRATGRITRAAHAGMPSASNRIECGLDASANRCPLRCRRADTACRLARAVRAMHAIRIESHTADLDACPSDVPGGTAASRPSIAHRVQAMPSASPASQAAGRNDSARSVPQARSGRRARRERRLPRESRAAPPCRQAMRGTRAPAKAAMAATARWPHP